MKTYPEVLTSLIKPQIWPFHEVVSLTTAKKWTKVKNACAGRAKLLFFSTTGTRTSKISLSVAWIPIRAWDTKFGRSGDAFAWLK